MGPLLTGVTLRSIGLYEEAGAAYLATLDLNTRQVDATTIGESLQGYQPNGEGPRAFRRVIDIDSDTQFSSRALAQLRTLDSKQPKGE